MCAATFVWNACLVYWAIGPFEDDLPCRLGVTVREYCGMSWLKSSGLFPYGNGLGWNRATLRAARSQPKR